MENRLADFWGYIAGGAGSAAAALLASHAKVRDRVGRLEVKVEELAGDVSLATTRIEKTHDAVVRLEAKAESSSAAMDKALPKLDELLNQQRRRRERYGNGRD